MKRTLSLITSSMFVMTLLCTPAVQAEEEWIKLFNGKNLNGWVQKNGTATYEVKDGTIVGTTAEGSPNSFLCSKKRFSDFELQFEVKVHDKLNSGVQIRSKTKKKDDPNSKNKNDKQGRVFGPQVEIEASGPNGAEAGFVYGEATGRGWLSENATGRSHKAMKDGEWNSFRVVAQGNHIQTWINGKQIADLKDDEILKTHPKGFIGLQVHGIGNEPGPYDVAWRNIRIKEL